MEKPFQLVLMFYRYRKRCTIARKPGSGCTSKITVHVQRIVELQMRRDHETTAIQLHELLLHNGTSVSLRTVLRCREQLGWTFWGSAYCPLIRDVNKQKRLEWAKRHTTDSFDNVIFWWVLCSDWNSSPAVLQEERGETQAQTSPQTPR